MNRLTNDQLHEMLVLQQVLNSKVDPKWIEKNYPWCRAIRVECAELSEHIGWKWWKHQSPNMVQAHIELVDIWHFMLSSALASNENQVMAAIDAINGGLMFPHMEMIHALGKKFCINGLELHEKVDVLSAFASLGYTFPALFEAIMKDCELSWATLRRMYLAKNVLNIFRQDNGYKAGTYVKDWGGVEDNVRLEQIMEAQPNCSAEELHAELTRMYQGVTA